MAEQTKQLDLLTNRPGKGGTNALDGNPRETGKAGKPSPDEFDYWQGRRASTAQNVRRIEKLSQPFIGPVAGNGGIHAEAGNTSAGANPQGPRQHAPISKLNRPSIGPAAGERAPGNASEPRDRLPLSNPACDAPICNLASTCPDAGRVASGGGEERHRWLIDRAGGGNATEWGEDEGHLCGLRNEGLPVRIEDGAGKAKRRGAAEVRALRAGRGLVNAIVRLDIGRVERRRHREAATRPEAGLFRVGVAQFEAGILPRVKPMVRLAPIGADGRDRVLDEVRRTEPLAPESGALEQPDAVGQGAKALALKPAGAADSQMVARRECRNEPDVGLRQPPRRNPRLHVRADRRPLPFRALAWLVLHVDENDVIAGLGPWLSHVARLAVEADDNGGASRVTFGSWVQVTRPADIAATAFVALDRQTVWAMCWSGDHVSGLRIHVIGAELCGLLFAALVLDLLRELVGPSASGASVSVLAAEHHDEIVNAVAVLEHLPGAVAFAHARTRWPTMPNTIRSPMYAENRKSSTFAMAKLAAMPAMETASRSQPSCSAVMTFSRCEIAKGGGDAEDAPAYDGGDHRKAKKGQEGVGGHADTGASGSGIQ